MDAAIEPLKFYQEPVSYTGFAAFIAIVLVVLSIGTGSMSGLLSLFIIVAFILCAVTYVLWDTRCPNCKRSFAKAKDGQEKTAERTEKRVHYDKTRYLYSDGSIKKEENGQAHEIDHKIVTYKYSYHCKKCNHVWSKEREIDLTHFEPIITTIQTTEKNPILPQSGPKTPSPPVEKPPKIPPLSKYEAEKIIMQRGNKCQYPNCNQDISLEVHHIVPRSNGGNNHNSNLIVLCPTHHKFADSGAINATRLRMIVSSK